jgi:ABC-type dipeptide/oligopeptide/nickel transport system permease component
MFELPSPEAIFAMIVFSIIGLSAFRSGKRAVDWKAMVIGIILMVYPYFIDGTIMIWIVGAGLTACLILFRE